MEKDGKKKRRSENSASADDRPKQRWRAHALEEEEEASAVTASDEEVEEFFAIIRRMHQATRALSGSRAETARPAREKEGPPAVARWKPTFLPEDFCQEMRSKANSSPSEAISVAEEKPDAGKRGGGGLDLNVEPEVEGLVPG